jgi:CHAT domain-containing protein
MWRSNDRGRAELTYHAAVTLALLLALLSMDPRGAEPADIVSRYWTARAGGDGPAAAAVWDPQTAAGLKVEQSIAILSRARCTRLEALTIDQVELDGDHARVVAHADLATWTEMAPTREWLDSVPATFDLTRTGDQWRITGYLPDSEAIANEIGTTAARSSPISNAQRQALVEKASALAPAVALILSRRAVRLINQDELDAASILIDLAQDIGNEASDDTARSMAAGARSVLLRYGSSTDWKASLSSANESLALAERAANPDAIGRALLRVTRSGQIGDPAVDRLPCERALALESYVEDRSVIALCATQLAQLASDTADHRRELRYALIAMKNAQESGDTAALMSASTNLGGAYQAMGDEDIAGPYFQRAYEIGRDAHFSAAWTIVPGQGDIRLRRSISDELLREIDARIAALGPKAEPGNATQLYQMRARALITRNPDAAEVALDRAVELAQHLLDWRDAAVVAFLRGALRLEQRRFGEARDLLQSNTVFPHSVELARAQLGLEDRAGAIATLRADIAAVEGDLVESPPGITRARMVANTAETYTLLAQLLVEDHEEREALAIVERLRARSLRDLLDGDRLMQRASLTATERQNAAEIDRGLNRLNRQLAAACANRETPACNEVLEQVASARAESKEFLAATYANHPSAGRVSSAALQTDLPAALGDSVVLEYLVDRDKTIVFSVRRTANGTRVRATTIRAGRAALEKSARALRQAIAETDFRWMDRAQALYQLLIAPIKSEIAHASSIVIVPDGPLWTIPFNTLIDPSARRLIEKFAISYAPSIDSLHRMMSIRGSARGASKSVLAMGNPTLREPAPRPLHYGARFPPLPHAAQEARIIASLYGGANAVYVAKDATESTFRAQAADYKIIHLGTHAIVDDKAPLYSAIVLRASSEEDGDDGLLEAREIADLSLRANLVVLSACDTAQGAVVTGEGVIGLSWAFLAAGTPTIVVSQWSVSSEPTASLMVDFHRRVRKGESFAQALRHAELALCNNPRYDDPRYWSPFIVLGAP